MMSNSELIDDIAETVGRIASIRAKNNDFWMQVLEIALRHAPDETKRILAGIND